MMTLGSLAMLFATGCQTYDQQAKKMTGHWQRGDAAAAAAEFGVKAEKEKNSKDTVIWRLEQGAALRAAGQYKESTTAFEAAEEKINKYDEAAKVKVGGEALALMSNQAQLPYEGRAYDKIMLNTYKALNYLQMGEQEKARVEFIRAQQRQDEAVELNKARVEKAEAQLVKEKEEKKFDPDKTKKDPKFKAKFDGAYAFLEKYESQAKYKNAAAVYLYGLFFMAASTGSADWELAKHSFDEVSGMVGESNLPATKFMQEEKDLLESIMAGKPVRPTTYVIFETGRAPIRDQIRIDLPLFIVGARNVPYVGAAFPTLKLQDGHLSCLEVTSGEIKASTVLLVNMDSIVGREFKDELPTIITKTMVSTLAKAAAAYAVNQAASQQSDMAGLFAKLGTAIAQAAVNIADTRTWTTLPKEFQVCRVATPADRKIQLAGIGDQLKAEVVVEDGTINLVYVKAINTHAPLIVSQTKLK